jgi:hypothetical protein
MLKNNESWRGCWGGFEIKGRQGFCASRNTEKGYIGIGEYENLFYETFQKNEFRFEYPRAYMNSVEYINNDYNIPNTLPYFSLFGIASFTNGVFSYRYNAPSIIWEVEFKNKAHLIPCYRKSDKVAGMYDRINDVFYTNAGTDLFIVGPDIN